MTSAQPGQEQRTVTDAMIEAGVQAFWPDTDRRPALIAPLVERIYTAMHEARPTADLGEDGELERKLRRTSIETVFDDLENSGRRETRSLLVNPDGLEAADRIELYREALVDAREQIGAYGYSTVHGRRVRQSWAAELLAKIDAVLSRSGL